MPAKKQAAPQKERRPTAEIDELKYSTVQVCIQGARGESARVGGYGVQSPQICQDT